MFPKWLSGTEPLPHTRCRASVPVVFVVLCVHMYSFAGLIRRTPPPTFSDTAITLIPIFYSSELTGCGYPGLLDWKNRSDMCPRWEWNPRLPACKASTLSTRPGSPLLHLYPEDSSVFINQMSSFIILGASHEFFISPL